MREKSNNNILVFSVDKVLQIVYLFDHIVASDFNAGKKTDKHWIIKTAINLVPDGTTQTEQFNQLMKIAQMKGFTEIMVTF